MTERKSIDGAHKLPRNRSARSEWSICVSAVVYNIWGVVMLSCVQPLVCMHAALGSGTSVIFWMIYTDVPTQ